MRSYAELAAVALVCALDTGCERERRAPSEGAAKPLVLGAATASRESSDARSRPPGAMGCVPGTHRCAGEKLEACDTSTGGFVQVNVCQSAAHCNAKLKQCLVDPCILGEHQCNEAVLEQCHANGWTRVRQCDSADACDAERGQCREPD